MVVMRATEVGRNKVGKDKGGNDKTKAESHFPSWVRDRSRCDHCQRQVAWYDNVPLLSFMLLGGKCRWCRKPIAFFHPVIELLTGALFVWWYWGGSLFFRLTQEPFVVLQPLFWLIVAILLIIIFFADLKSYLIPDGAVSLLFLLTFIYRLGLVLAGIVSVTDFAYQVLGLVVSVGLIFSLWLVTKGQGMGFGDVKLVAPLALLVGWPQTLVFLFASFVIGSVVGVALVILGRKKMKQVIPFGPFLIVGALVTLLWGDVLINWYWSMIGW